MTLKRHQRFYKEVDKEWSNKLFGFIESQSHKPWNWQWISCNPNITIETIEAHLDKPWDWMEVSRNPNLTMKIIEAHPDKPWEWILVSQISFQKDKEQFIERKAREYMAAYKIRRAWLECYLSPYTIIGKKRLEKEYNAMVKEHNELFGYTSS